MDYLLFPGCEKCVRLHQAILDAYHPVAETDAWLDYLGHLHVAHGADERLFEKWMVREGFRPSVDRTELVIRGGGQVPTPRQKVAR